MLSLRKHTIWSGLSVLLLVFGSPFVAAQDDAKAAKERGEIDSETADVIKEFRAMNGGDAAYNKAAGYAVFRVTKAGLGASGAGGGGKAVDKKAGTQTYMRMGSAGVGFTFGVSKYDIVILFETPEKLAAFTKGGWDSAATAQAAAGSEGTEISSTFFEGVAYYQFSKKGLMASADVSGTKFWIAEELTPK